MFRDLFHPPIRKVRQLEGRWSFEKGMNSDPFLACWSPLLVNLLKLEAFKPRQKQIGLRSLGSYLSERPTVSGVVNGWGCCAQKNAEQLVWWCISFILFYSKHLGDGEREDAECFPCLTCACFVSTGWWRTINLKNQHFAFNIMHNLQSKVIEAQNISWQKVQSSISFAWFIRFWISQSRGMIYPINTPLFYKVYLSWGWLWRGPPIPANPQHFPYEYAMLHQLQWWRWKLFTPITKAAHYPGLQWPWSIQGHMNQLQIVVGNWSWNLWKIRWSFWICQRITDKWVRTTKPFINIS